ncbi:MULTISPECIES: hypothetical protein [Sphingopyxis]|uniref:Uncharacterized protein n=1 Tax=Sphingopyxis granuli TaxID=267128 RepID=A0AA86GSR5_9SPHN|nr:MULTISPECIES: hypothetical protein [Sphingopyxis]AMG76486.1 Uncharacterized protein SGRAN_4159 [Sphingopyxis granuli]APW74027.1 hypothetical protein BWD40_15530 [Sphingopyxis granuli]AVA15360.1 hypothetical protein C3E99_17215 [Sphingopyxis sp. MG]
MFWWDWTTKQKLLLLAAMLAIAAAPWMLLGWFPGELGAFVGGTSFLMIPQLVGWLLVVGLKTGRMPMPYGNNEDRESSPVAFWIVAAGYAALCAYAIWIILMVGVDIAMNGLH